MTRLMGLSVGIVGLPSVGKSSIVIVVQHQDVILFRFNV